MIYYDDIVRTINGSGGISVLFDQIYNNFHNIGVDYRTFSFNGSGDYNLSPRLFERYRDFESGVEMNSGDVFHSTYYRLPKIKNAKIVTTVHDFTYERLLSGPKKIVHSSQKRRAVLSSDKIICVSKNTADDLLYYIPDVDPEKIEVVLNGVADEFTPSSNIYESENYILYVGSRSRYKNFEAAVLSVSKFNAKYRLLCVGGGEFSRHEVSLLNSNLGEGMYNHAGYVTVDELVGLYQKAFALIYPSLYEGFGIPILEAFKSGCPVVAVDTSSIPEVAGGAALLSKSGSSEDLFRELKKIEDRILREELIDLGIAQSLKFSWSSTANNTLKIYEELMAQG